MTDAALDHVGIVTRDLSAVADQYERLGFTLTPFARYSDGRIGNRCAMLQHGYIELLAIADASRGSATLDGFLARYAGIHIIAFAITDVERELQRLRRAGMAVTAVGSERPVAEADRDGPHARFIVLAAPAQPEGRLNLVRHLTPGLLWQEQMLRHANNAVALEEVVAAVADPAEAAERFSRIAGCAVAADQTGGFALELREGRVRLLAGSTLGPAIPEKAAVLPKVVGITLRTSDGNDAISRIVAERRIRHRQLGNALVVDADEAGGASLRCVGA